MRLYFVFIFFIISSYGNEFAYEKKVQQLTDFKEELKEMAADSFYDENMDYSRFVARVTDRDKSANIFKVYSSNRNIKFFRSGDKILFYPANKREGDFCTGFVRAREKDYFTMYVKDIASCWQVDRYFRRGTMIKVLAEILAKRVKDASMHRVVLIKRRKDFLNQLNEINHFNHSYDQQRVQVAAAFDQKVLEIEKEKQRALDQLMTRRNESATIRQGLIYKLDHIDKNLEFYRVDPHILAGDRWFEDHDLGLPVKNRPQTQIIRQ